MERTGESFYSFQVSFEVWKLAMWSLGETSQSANLQTADICLWGLQIRVVAHSINQSHLLILIERHTYLQVSTLADVVQDFSSYNYMYRSRYALKAAFDGCKLWLTRLHFLWGQKLLILKSQCIEEIDEQSGVHTYYIQTNSNNNANLCTLYKQTYYINTKQAGVVIGWIGKW